MTLLGEASQKQSPFPSIDFAVTAALAVKGEPTTPHKLFIH